MKKVIFVLSIIFLTSCKKEETIQDQIGNVFVRVESVSKTGDSAYSDVQVVRMK